MFVIPDTSSQFFNKQLTCREVAALVHEDIGLIPHFVSLWDWMVMRVPFETGHHCHHIILSNGQHRPARLYYNYTREFMLWNWCRYRLIRAMLYVRQNHVQNHRSNHCVVGHRVIQSPNTISLYAEYFRIDSNRFICIASTTIYTLKALMFITSQILTNVVD